MTFHYSLPFEELIAAGHGPDEPITQARVVIVGSGYGGAVAALRLASRTPTHGLPHDVIVLERGREYALGDFPNILEDLPLHVQMRGKDGDGNGNEDALFDIRLGENVDALIGSGLGGTSLINANVAIRPDAKTFRNKPWPKALGKDEAKRELEEAFDAVEKWLGVTRSADVAAYPKHAALKRYAEALDIQAKPAPIAVTLQERDNAAGIRQPKCTGCGNCVTGCNVGAKNTVAMNLIPAAHECGARFYTGAIVNAVAPIRVDDRIVRWRVDVQPTSPLTRARIAHPLHIEADIVILAAGTFGSTEILMRSQALHFLRCSEQLGKHFSTNGDGLAMSYGESARVNAIGDRDYFKPATPAGPTITAVAAHKRSIRHPLTPDFLLEEGTVPAALVEIIGEVATTAAQVGRLGWNMLPAWFKGKAADPLAVHRGALDHSQIFLVMSDDQAAGSLVFTPPKKSEHGGGILPTWPKQPDSKRDRVNEVLRKVDNYLAEHDRRDGLSGGQYVRNPLWQTLPESTSGLQGKFPGGRLLTVHPLGGCGMGDDGTRGVVNHAGAVFDGPGTSTYPGLYVLDGSIVPGALGHNPFLTIAALAWRASGKIPGASDKQNVKAKAPVRSLDPPPPLEPSEAEIVVREQLIGQLVASEGDRRRITAALPTSERWFEHDGMILRVESDPGSTDVALSGTGPARVHVNLLRNPDTAAETRRWHTYGVSASRLTSEYLIASGTGTLTLMEAVPPKDDADLLERRSLALDEYERRRERPWWLALLRKAPIVGDKPPLSVPPFKHARGFLAAAEMQCTYRRFVYELKLSGSGRTIEITGTKLISWRKDATALWQAMSHLTLNFAFSDLGARATCDSYVDMDYLTGDGLLTVASDRNTPRAMFNCFAYGARLARGVMQSSFWEFGAPTYPKCPMSRDPALPEKIGTFKRTTIELPVQARLRALQGKKDQLTLRLHRYGGGAARGPVLLIHGLAQGSLIFAHKRLRSSMAHYLLEAGYEVWLLDYRLSNQFDAKAIPYDGWSIDEIGAHDIPMAILRVHKETGQRVHVFAHCVGAVGIAMAILRGRLSREQLASVALNAIHPWILPSPFNRIRAKLGVAFRDRIGNDYLDPIIQLRDEVDATQTLLDRIGFSIARIDEPPHRHSLDDDDLFNAVCDRMTFLYGRMWEHANVADIHGKWQDLVGAAPGSVYRHLHHMLTRERIVDREGRDDYLTPERIQNWRGIRTLFMHGEQSLVFNPQSATRSAIWLRHHLEPNQAVTPVRLRRIPRYGHMDVILAADAANDSFPYLDHFFRGNFDTSETYQVPNGPTLTLDPVLPRDDPAFKSRERAHCGPLMRAARVADGELIVRHWLEMAPDNSCNGTDPIRYLDPQPTSARLVDAPTNVQTSYKWIEARYDPSKWADFPAAWLSRLPGVGSSTRDCHFIVASCWYPGMPFDRERHDQTFAGIGAAVDNGAPCDAVFLLGDQIYADANGGVLDPVSWLDRYVNRYREAFNGPRARTVLGKIPVHFTIDDHEIANDFAGCVTSSGAGLMPGTERTARMRRGDIDDTQLQTAKLWARSYLSAARDEPFGTSKADGRELWYALDQRELACPAFVMDTRSRRKRADAHSPALLLGETIASTQLRELLDWLTGLAADPRPKFIFAGSAIAPVETAHARAALWMREDGFAGYPAELEAIVAHIVRHDIARVVFVSGDLHLSAIARLTLLDSSGRQAQAVQIVASALYAPLAFVNTAVSDIDWASTTTIRAGAHSIRYQPQLLSAAAAHFVKVGAVPAGAAWRISATPHGPEGQPSGPTLTIDI